MATGGGHTPVEAEQVSASLNSTLLLWKQRAKEWYPDLYQRTYLIPPVHMNKTQHQERQVSGRRVYVTQPPVTDQPRGAVPALRESDVRDDVSQRKVLHSLRRLPEANGEGMFVLSQLNFGFYLNEPIFAAAASALLRPVDLKGQNKNRGDFDVLIIHKKYGIMVGEIKAVGDLMSSFTPQQLDQQVKKKIEESIKQLQKADDVLRHLVSYLEHTPQIQKTLMLPNVTRAQLKRVLWGDLQLTKDLQNILNITTNDDLSTLCMTSDDIENPAEWWSNLVNAAGSCPVMTNDVYLDLVSRFCGPATTVKVYCSSIPRLAQAHRSDIRTPGEAVQETATRFAPVDIVLHPTQVDALNNLQPLVYVNGPPGTGKTLVLILKALEWLGQQKSVHIVSVWSYSLAVSMMIFNQLKNTEPNAKKRLYMHSFDFDKGDSEVDTAVNTLMNEVKEEELYLIMDEVSDLAVRPRPGSGEIQRFTDMCNKLKQRVPNLYIWSAALYHKSRPDFLNEVILTEALRSPPSVTEHVEKLSLVGPKANVYTYSDPVSPPPSDGPPIRLVTHPVRGHKAAAPVECEECGRRIAEILLGLIVGGSARTALAPQPLEYRDVFILINGSEIDNSCNVMQSAKGLLRGLKEAGVPFTELSSGDSDALQDVVTMEGPDQALVAYGSDVQGLERKIIVYVETEEGAADELGRLRSASRCISQLILVCRQNP